MKHESSDMKTNRALLCQSIAVYLHLAATFQTHLLLAFVAFFSSKQFEDDFKFENFAWQFKLFLICCHRKLRGMSAGMFASLSLSLHISHTSQFHSVSPICCVLYRLFSISISDVSFSYLSCFSHPSYSPLFSFSHIIFHLNNFSISHTLASSFSVKWKW